MSFQKRVEILKRDTYIAIGFISAFLFLTILVSNINTDAVINVQIEYEFTVTDFKISALNQSGGISVDNQTYDKYDLNIQSIYIFFDDVLGNYTFEQMNEFVSKASLENSQNITNDLNHNFFAITGGDYREIRPQNLYFKVPKNNLLAFILIESVAYSEDPDVNSVPIRWYGFVQDSENSLKEMKNKRLIIEINSLVFKADAYDNYHNYMNGDSDIIPSVYPYQISFDLSEESLSFTDYLRR